jgi:hypothetical protein
MNSARDTTANVHHRLSLEMPVGALPEIPFELETPFRAPFETLAETEASMKPSLENRQFSE